MENEIYYKVEVLPGYSIEKAYEMLKVAERENGRTATADFNGKTLYSSQSLDEMYIKVTGMTYDQVKENQRKEVERIEKENKEFKARFAELREQYRERARGIIPEHLLPDWDHCVPVRLSDIYKGFELGCALDIISILNDNTLTQEQQFERCHKLFYEQGHSGGSAYLLFRLLKHFHPKGEEFARFVTIR